MVVMATPDTTAAVTSTTSQAAAPRTWSDIRLGLTAAETERVNSSLDTVFDAFVREAA